MKHEINVINDLYMRPSSDSVINTFRIVTRCQEYISQGAVLTTVWVAVGMKEMRGKMDGAGILCSARMRIDFHEIQGTNIGKTKGSNGWPDGVEDCRETSLLRVKWEEEFLWPGT